MEYKNVKFEVKSVDEGTFEGYASTWDKDEGNDVIVKGAFAKTLKERGDKIKVLWQHDTHNPIGKALEMYEDEKGLYIKAKISDTSVGKDAKQLLKDGVIDSMSIGYSIPDKKSEMDGDTRIIREIKLYEFSLVTFPMNENALISTIKSLSNQLNAELKERIEGIFTEPQKHSAEQVSEELKQRLEKLVKG